MHKEGGGLYQGNPDRVALIGHDLEAFCKVSIDSFDHHWVMAVA
jgi:hypothetical protein